MANGESEPTTYVAFLRGINVGGHDRMSMEALGDLCESLGYENVRTHGGSGNVVFVAPAAEPVDRAGELAAAVDDEFGYDVSAILRTREELDDVVARQPFDEPSDEDTKLYVTFLEETPGDEQVRALLDACSDAETFVADGRAVYSELRKDRLGRGQFTDVGDVLGMAATRRTWDVVTKVRELASD